MADVSVRATLSGFPEARQQIQGVATDLRALGGAGGGIVPPFNAANDAVKSFGGNLAQMASGAVRAGAILGGGLIAGIGAVAYALAPAVKEMLAAGEALHDMSEATGLSVERLSELKALAAINGASFEAVSSGIGRFDRNISRAARGTGEAAMAFKAMGIELRDVNGQMRTGDELLLEVADKFKEYTGSAEKAALAQALFGGNWKAMLEVLNEGRKGLEEAGIVARSTGQIMEAETARGADAFNKEMRIMGEQVKGVARDLAGPLVKSLGEVAREMKLARDEGEGFWGTMLRGMRAAVSFGFFPSTASGLKDVNKEIAQTITLMADAEARQARGALNQGQVEAAARKLSDLYKEQARLQGLAEFDRPRADAGGTQAPEMEKVVKAKKVSNELQRLQDQGLRHAMDAMDLEIKAGRATAEEKIRLIDAVLATDVGSTALRMQLVKERASTVDAANKRELQSIEAIQKAEEQHAKLSAQLLRDASKATEDYANTQVNEIKRTSASYEELRARVTELIDELEAAGGVSHEVAKKIRNANRDVLDESANDATRMRQIWGRSTFDMVSAFGGFHRSVQGAFSGILQGTMSVAQGFKAIWKGAIAAVADELGRLAASWVMRTMAQMLGIGGAPAAGGGGGGGFNLANFAISAGLNFLLPGAGAAFSLLSGGGGGFGLGASDLLGVAATFAQHGTDQLVSKPTMFVAGEMGEERVRVEPLFGGRGEGRGGAVNIHYHGAVIADNYTARRFARDQARAMRRYA